MSSTILATEHASATAGREGNVKSPDGKIDLAMSPPGSNGPGSNPEQLFAAGYAACFGQALKAMAAKEGLKPERVAVNATVKLHKGEDGGFYISVNLDGDLPGLSQQDAEKLMRLGHQICPYSKATRGNIDVTLQANGGAALSKAA